jgi:hypothetical protein
MHEGVVDSPLQLKKMVEHRTSFYPRTLTRKERLWNVDWRLRKPDRSYSMSNM